MAADGDGVVFNGQGDGAAVGRGHGLRRELLRHVGFDVLEVPGSKQPVVRQLGDRV